MFHFIMHKAACLFNAWETASEVRGSVTEKRTQIESRDRKLKMELTLKHQVLSWIKIDFKHFTGM